MRAPIGLGVLGLKTAEERHSLGRPSREPHSDSVTAGHAAFAATLRGEFVDDGGHDRGLTDHGVVPAVYLDHLGPEVRGDSRLAARLVDAVEPVIR